MSFVSSLATKCMSLNDEPCMSRLTIIELNYVELKYYRFINSLHKCSRNCNSYLQNMHSK